MSYEEAARMCGTGIGTIKSRINRARGRLSQMLGDEVEDAWAHRPRPSTARTSISTVRAVSA
jgi:RNA polymerase sigma-70 factor (ECF subfamily)